MGRTFTANINKDGDWYVAQAIEIDVASQGKSSEESLDNLREAIELYLESPTSPSTLQVNQPVEVEAIAG